MDVLLSMVLINRINKYILLLDNLLFNHSSEENLLFLFSWFLIHEVPLGALRVQIKMFIVSRTNSKTVKMAHH